VVSQLRDERYARLVIEVDVPRTTAATIQKALGEVQNMPEAGS
jgi:hypothetical protein